MTQINKNIIHLPSLVKNVSPFYLLLAASFMLLATLLPTFSYAIEDFKPALIYESEINKGDNAFIDSMHKGAEEAKAEIGFDYEEFIIPKDHNRVEYMRKVSQSGVTHIIAVGFQNVVPTLTVAEEFPEIKFTVIDGIVPPIFNNVQSINFKDNEGAFLVGMIAGYTSKTDHVGFIGGMDVPVISNFAIGFYQGAKYANPEITIAKDTIGTDYSSWNNPEKARALAKKQFNHGADVIFAAAGGSSVGVLEAAEDVGKFAIGVDSNQNALFPGTVLTSMIKRVDQAVYTTLINAFSGRWEPGIKYMGIRENSLDYAVDVHNRRLLNKNIINQLENAKEKIIRGDIIVDSYKPY